MATLELISNDEIDALIAAMTDPAVACRCIAMVEYLSTSPDRKVAVEFLRDALDENPLDAPLLAFLSQICPGAKEILDTEPALIEGNHPSHN